MVSLCSVEEKNVLNLDEKSFEFNVFQFSFEFQQCKVRQWIKKAIACQFFQEEVVREIQIAYLLFVIKRLP